MHRLKIIWQEVNQRLTPRASQTVQDLLLQLPPAASSIDLLPTVLDAMIAMRLETAGDDQLFLVYLSLVQRYCEQSSRCLPLPLIKVHAAVSI